MRWTAVLAGRDQFLWFFWFEHECKFEQNISLKKFSLIDKFWCKLRIIFLFSISFYLQVWTTTTYIEDLDNEPAKSEHQQTHEHHILFITVTLSDSNQVLKDNLYDTYQEAEIEQTKAIDNYWV